ncbi:MAG: hypothetical protein Q8J64_07535 [Thermodesulfovibrionales bacterium]|nr:hypothetical protein [Thermodesulfovibrionales bacterium]
MKGSNFINRAAVIAVITAMTAPFWPSYAETSGSQVSDIKLAHLRKAPESKWGRDPFIKYDDRFKRPEALKEQMPVIKISGIISDGGKAVAIINGEFLRKGDMVSGFKIADISGDNVLLEKNGGKFLLGIDRFALRGLK